MYVQGYRFRYKEVSLQAHSPQWFSVVLVPVAQLDSRWMFWFKVISMSSFNLSNCNAQDKVHLQMSGRTPNVTWRQLQPTGVLRAEPWLVSWTKSPKNTGRIYFFCWNFSNSRRIESLSLRRPMFEHFTVKRWVFTAVVKSLVKINIQSKVL